MKDLLSYILKNVMPEDTQITIDEQDVDGFVTLSVTAPQEQIGKIIGKNGKTINAIKQIVKIKAIKENKRVEIEVKEAEITPQI